MNRTHKKFLGFLGLFLVIATTIFAAFLPGPATSATSSVTDTIVVRVVGAVPRVDFIDAEMGKIYTTPNQSFSFSYENIATATVTIRYTDVNGVTHTYPLNADPYDLDYGVGDMNFSLNLAERYGYGDYIITVAGDGTSGADEDSISFSYYPVYGEATENEDGNINLGLEYDPDDETGSGDGEVANIIVKVYDEEGNLVTPLSPVTVTPPTTSIELPFSDYDLPSGTYTIEITAYDRDGNELYKAYLTYVIYESKTIPVPDTGELFKNLNISRVDYLITGLIIFSLVGVGGAIFINKRSKRTTKRRR